MRVSDVHDIAAELRNEIEHFFQVYKDLEEAKVETHRYGTAPRPSAWWPRLAPARAELPGGARRERLVALSHKVDSRLRRRSGADDGESTRHGAP
jgi:hypothetical protein